MAREPKSTDRASGISDLSDPVDIYVGSRLRMRREEANLTQTELGEMLGITFQQVQKYERGANRVSASRLFHLCQILDVDVDFFFEGYTGSSRRVLKAVRKRKQEDFGWIEEENGDLMVQKETLELIHVFYQVRDASVRKGFIRMLKSLVTSQH